MIVEDIVINEWKIYSAEQFKKEFGIEIEREDNETDEDYIMEHLQKDERMFKVTFMESERDNAYEEYWKIEEVE